jgi:hypothetical protein
MVTLAALNPSLLTALGYIGGAALLASIVGWSLAAIRTSRLEALDWAQHFGYMAGYVALWAVSCYGSFVGSRTYDESRQ